MTFSIFLTILATNAQSNIKCDYKRYERREVFPQMCLNGPDITSKTLEECLADCDGEERCDNAHYGVTGIFKGKCSLKLDCKQDNFDIEAMSNPGTWDVFARRCDDTPTDPIPTEPISVTTNAPDSSGKCGYKKYERMEVRDAFCTTADFKSQMSLEECQAACDLDENCGVALYGRPGSIASGVCTLQGNCMNDDFNIESASVTSRNWDAYARRCDNQQHASSVIKPSTECDYKKYQGREVVSPMCGEQKFSLVTVDECLLACDDEETCGVAHFKVSASGQGQCNLYLNCSSEDFDVESVSRPSHWDAYARRC